MSEFDELRKLMKDEVDLLGPRTSSGGPLIREDLEKVLYDHYLKEIWWNPDRGYVRRPLTRRDRLGLWIESLRHRLADRIGGNVYYTEGCDHDIDY